MEDGHKTRRVFDTPGEAHELTFSCLHGMPLLQSEHAKVAFLEELNQARAKLDFELWAYVLMYNHAHLLVWPRRPTCSMSLMLKAMKQPVSQRLIAEIRREDPGALERLVSRRRKGARVYSIWQPGGGYDRNMTSKAAIDASIDYIHMNPVRKGLVSSPLDWEWSSARQYHGKGLFRFVVDFPK
jgi:putative transposase